jgi:hypothetical protein
MINADLVVISKICKKELCKYSTEQLMDLYYKIILRIPAHSFIIFNLKAQNVPTYLPDRWKRRLPLLKKLVVRYNWIMEELNTRGYFEN